MRRFVLALLLFAQVAGQAQSVYNAENTYRKLLPKYPFIHIAGSTLALGVVAHKDITYAQRGALALQLDLVLPKPGPLAAVVVLVHGGGWQSGDRHEFAALAARLAERGYASAAVSYRLAGQALYPAAVDDVREAVRWVRANAAEYGIDGRHIAIAGGSAGGQIASLVGVTGAGVQAIVNIDGLSDFTSEEARKHEDDPAKKPSSAGTWFGGTYAEKGALWREASPTFYVNAATPPILFIGSAQTRFSVGREEMVAKLQAAGVPSRVVKLPDSPHSFWMFDPWLQPTVDAIVAFLDERWR